MHFRFWKKKKPVNEAQENPDEVKRARQKPNSEPPRVAIRPTAQTSSPRYATHSTTDTLNTGTYTYTPASWTYAGGLGGDNNRGYSGGHHHGGHHGGHSGGHCGGSSSYDNSGGSSSYDSGGSSSCDSGGSSGGDSGGGGC